MFRNVTGGYPGYIEIESTTSPTVGCTDVTVYRVELVTDSYGYASISELAERSQRARKKDEIERKIAELQAELDAL